MVNKDITRLDLVKGATIFRQGHRDTLSFIPRNAQGEIVDLTGKVIDVVIVHNKVIAYEGVAAFNSEDSTIQFTIDENIGYGDMWMEFTVTDPNDPTYRQKFPTSEYDGKLKFIRSSDDLPYVGFSGKTVAQFEADQQTFMSAVEGDILTIEQTVDSKIAEVEQTVQEGIGAFTEDTEVINARQGKATLGENLNGITAQLAEKAAKTEVTNSLSLKRDKSTKLEQADLSETLQGQILTNTIALNAVPANKSVTPIKTDFLTSKTVNIYDSSKAVDGSINISNGTVTTDPNYKVSEFIEVSAGDTFATNSNAVGGYYDANKAYVQYIAYNAPKPLVVPSGLGIKYMRVAFGISQVPTARIFRGATLLPYTPYDPNFKISTSLKLTSENFETPKIIGVENVTFIKQKPNFNIFNKATAIDGFYPNANTMNASVDWASTDFMPVEEGKTYKHNSGGDVMVVYDANKVNILQLNASIVTIPAGGRYLRVGIKKATRTIDTFMMVEGSVVPTTYYPYVESNVLDNIKLPEKPLRWEGKKHLGIGDSISFMTFLDPDTGAMVNYLDIMKIKLKTATLKKCAEPSKRMNEIASIMAYSGTTTQDIIDSDLITVMLGANDGGTPIGSITDPPTTDMSSFHGSVKGLIEYLLGINSKARLVFFTPTPRADQATRARADAIKNVCLLYNIPVLDLNAVCGFNSFNYAHFYNPDGVHMKIESSKRIGQIAGSFVEQL